MICKQICGFGSYVLCAYVCDPYLQEGKRTWRNCKDNRRLAVTWYKDIYQHLSKQKKRQKTFFIPSFCRYQPDRLYLISFLCLFHTHTYTQEVIRGMFHGSSCLKLKGQMIWRPFYEMADLKSIFLYNFRNYVWWCIKVNKLHCASQAKLLIK